jgi:hypothetical protein
VRESVAFYWSRLKQALDGHFLLKLSVYLYLLSAACGAIGVLFPFLRK